jgi:hypothetical protein
MEAAWRRAPPGALTHLGGSHGRLCRPDRAAAHQVSLLLAGHRGRARCHRAAGERRRARDRVRPGLEPVALRPGQDRASDRGRPERRISPARVGRQTAGAGGGFSRARRGDPAARRRGRYGYRHVHALFRRGSSAGARRGAPRPQAGRARAVRGARTRQRGGGGALAGPLDPPLWRSLAVGCNLNRAVVGLLQEAGFGIEVLDQHYLRATPRPIGFLSCGSARSLRAAA